MQILVVGLWSTIAARVARPKVEVVDGAVTEAGTRRKDRLVNHVVLVETEADGGVDPSLIIYAPVRVLGNNTIVTNGDQTDTVYEGLEKGLTFEQSLRSRQFEPDEPNCTPRISGLLHIADGEFHYAMSILKSNNGNPASNNRYTYTYENPIAGEGRFIHTYMHDGNPLPSFEGEPKWISIPDDMNAFTDALWNSLNEENKVSLFVRYIDIATGTYETKIINKNQ